MVYALAGMSEWQAAWQTYLETKVVVVLGLAQGWLCSQDQGDGPPSTSNPVFVSLLEGGHLNGLGPAFLFSGQPPEGLYREFRGLAGCEHCSELRADFWFGS